MSDKTKTIELNNEKRDKATSSRITALKWANQQAKFYSIREKVARKRYRWLVSSLFIINLLLISLLPIAIWFLVTARESLTILEMGSTIAGLIVIGLLIFLNFIIAIVRTTRKTKYWWKATDEIQYEVAKYRYRIGEYKDKNKVAEETLVSKVKNIEKKYKKKHRKISIWKVMRLAITGGQDA